MKIAEFQGCGDGNPCLISTRKNVQKLEFPEKFVPKVTFVTPIGFFSNPEFLKELKEMYKLRLILDEDQITTIPTKKLD
jgi:hypothetical protein